jgi:hypothetical protein
MPRRRVENSEIAESRYEPSLLPSWQAFSIQREVRRREEGGQDTYSCRFLLHIRGYAHERRAEGNAESIRHLQLLVSSKFGMRP